MSSSVPSSRATEINRQSRYPLGSFPSAIAAAAGAGVASSARPDEGDVAAPTAARMNTAIVTKTVVFMFESPVELTNSRIRRRPHLLNERTHVEELLARDHAVLHR